MEKIFALVKQGKVENTIVADEAFIALIQGQYDHCIRIDNLGQSVGIGHTYDSQNNTFTDPQAPVAEQE